MENITATTKNSDIVINHEAFGLTKDEAVALVMDRMAEYSRNNQPALGGKAPKGGWTDSDRVAK